MLPVRPVRPARDQDDERDAPTTSPEHHEKKEYKAERRDRRMSRPKFSMSPMVWISAIVVVVVLVGGYMWLRPAGAGIDTGKYQAVLLTDNSAYFGKLHVIDDHYMKLTDVYYLQSKTLQDTSATQPELQLIKLGEEVQGPTDEIIISRDKIVYFENLKETGKVTTAIKKYLSEKK